MSGPDDAQQAGPSPPPQFNFVLVPVPEEHVGEISQLILQASFRDTLTQWDEGAVHRLRAALNGPAWALVAALARAGRPLDEVEVSQEVGVPTEDVGPLRDRVTAACAIVERIDIIVEAPGERTAWTIRGVALASVQAVLDQNPPAADA